MAALKTVEGERPTVITIPRRYPSGEVMSGQVRGYVLETPNTKGTVSTWFGLGPKKEVTGTTYTAVRSPRVPASVSETGKLPDGTAVTSTGFLPNGASERRRLATIGRLQASVIVGRRAR